MCLRVSAYKYTRAKGSLFQHTRTDKDAGKDEHLWKFGVRLEDPFPPWQPIDPPPAQQPGGPAPGIVLG